MLKPLPFLTNPSNPITPSSAPIPDEKSAGQKNQHLALQQQDLRFQKPLLQQSTMKFKLLKEFKEFAIKGNMIDIAIGVIIGAAFNKVVDVIVNQIFLQPLSLLTGGVSFADKRFVLREALIVNGVEQRYEIAIGYGKMIQVSLDFLIIALTVFIVVKFMNALRNKADDPKNPAEVTPKNIELLNRISELMEKQVELLKKMNPGESKPKVNN